MGGGQTKSNQCPGTMTGEHIFAQVEMVLPRGTSAPSFQTVQRCLGCKIIDNRKQEEKIPEHTKGFSTTTERQVKT